MSVRQFFITLLFAAVGAVATAQVPDNDKIFAAINDINSQFYYPNLMMRYQAGEPLTDEQYHYLYYGFAYHENYKPMATNNAITDLYASMMTLNRYARDIMAAHDCHAATDVTGFGGDDALIRAEQGGNDHGIGLRAAINKAKVNIRFDIARSNVDPRWNNINAYSFYLTATEAF